jgi:segregation and condensation protein A
MSAEACRISLDAFEGPLDLLLYLIRREELDIYEISVAGVAQQYLDYIRSALVLDLDVASEYLVMAATLAGIKSRALLPAGGSSAEEEDPEEALLRQLVLYKAFKEVADELRDSESVWRNVFPSQGERDRWSADAPATDPGQLTIVDLLGALEALAVPDEGPPEHRYSRPVLTVAECMMDIGRSLAGGGWTPLSTMVGRDFTRARIVGFFVALLELVRRGWVSFRQHYPFEEIEFTRTGRWKDA